MKSNDDNKEQKPKKGFFARMIEDLDRKMAEKAGSGGCGCCSGSADKKGKSC
jgi:hypothetical protein